MALRSIYASFFTFLIIIGLLALLGMLSVYDTTRAKHLSLPLPTSISALTATTPFLSGTSLLLSRYHRFARFARYFFFVISILVAVLSSLVGPYVGRGPGEACILESQWGTLYHDQNSKALKIIEEALQCCGFKLPTDRPWPHPQKNSPSPCTDLYGWQASCQKLWGNFQHKIATELLVVLLVSWIIHVLGLLMMEAQRRWEGGSAQGIFNHDQERYRDEISSRRAIEAVDDVEENENGADERLIGNPIDDNAWAGTG